MKHLLGIVLLLGISGYAVGQNLSDFMQNLNVEYFTNENSTELSDKELILSKYCGGIFIEHTNGLSYSMDNTHFNANDSLFLQALCSVVHPYYNTSSLQKDFQQKLKLQLYKGIDDACAINKDHKMKDCDIYRYVTKIYTAVMSEIFKIKWAHVSQIYTSETISEDMTKRVAAVFSGYFNMRLEEKEYQKKFPATSTMIDRDQKFFAKTLKTLFIINNDELYKNSGKGCVGNTFSIACGLHSSDNGLNIAFSNLIYNEYLQYRLFIDYYTYQINQMVKKMLNEKKKTLASLSVEDTVELELLREIEVFQQEIKIAEEALEIALDDLQDFAATYPLHIGLVMYQEELKTFRDKYAVKMVTPFYTLYEKFRNVQPTK